MGLISNHNNFAAEVAAGDTPTVAQARFLFSLLSRADVADIISELEKKEAGCVCIVGGGNGKKTPGTSGDVPDFPGFEDLDLDNGDPDVGEEVLDPPATTKKTFMSTGACDAISAELNDAIGIFSSEGYLTDAGYLGGALVAFQVECANPDTYHDQFPKTLEILDELASGVYGDDVIGSASAVADHIRQVQAALDEA